MKSFVLAALGAAALALGLASGAAAVEPIRVGVLQYGTVNWQLDAMVRNGLDAANGVDVEIVPFAGEDASNIAFQSGDVDMIVSDWLWVSREREAGSDFTFAPYSTSVGSVMVPQDSSIKSLADLKNKTLGVVGGPLDKNWLLIQALARRDHGLDLAADATIVYGAPPLLTEKARSGELDAVLNYWHFAARLEAAGFRPLITGVEAETAMGTKGAVAALGWVFRESWAREHPAAIEGFLKADAAAKALLRESDEEWTRLEPLVKPGDEATLHALRDRYREGIPSRAPAEDRADAAKLYDILAEIGGDKLVGPGKAMAEGTYWSGLENGT